MIGGTVVYIENLGKVHSLSIGSGGLNYDVWEV